jgi:hypothetical protein
VVGVADAPLMADVRRSGYIQDLTRYIFEAVFLCLAAVVVGFVGYFPVLGDRYYQSVWLLAMFASCAAFVRIAVIFLLLFRKLRPK